jgi:predicted RNase H-like nuclease
MSLLDEEQKKLAAQAKEAAAAQPDPWRAMVAASNAFLDACLDKAVQRIVLIDAPVVLGWSAGARPTGAITSPV